MSFRLVALLLAVSAPGWGQWSGNAKRIQGVPVSPQRPTDGQSLVYNELQKMWVPSTVTGAGFPLVDTGARGDGYKAITLDYTLDSSCVENSYCGIKMLSGQLQAPNDGSFDASVLDLSVWQPLGNSSISLGAGLTFNPGVDSFANATFVVDGVASAGSSSFQTSCTSYFFSGGDGSTCGTAVHSTTGHVEMWLRTESSFPGLSVDLQRSVFDHPAALFTIGARDAPAGYSSFVIRSDFGASGGPWNYMSVGNSTAEVFVVGTDRVHVYTLLQLSETDSGALPACDETLSGTIANVRVNAENTELRFCKQVLGVWQWASL